MSFNRVISLKQLPTCNIKDVNQYSQYKPSPYGMLYKRWNIMKFVLDLILAIMWGTIAYVGFLGVARGFGVYCAMFWCITLIIALERIMSKIK